MTDASARPGPGLPGKIAVALLAPLVVFGLLEAGLRLTGVGRREAASEADPANRWVRMMMEQGLYQDDPLLFWRLRPVEGKRMWMVPDPLWINLAGFRYPDFDPARRVDLRIVAAGDSCTFGWGLATADAYPAILERELRRRMPGRTVQVINAGQPGHSSFQGRRLLEGELLGLEPDLVLLQYGWNDAMRRTGKPDSQKARVMTPLLRVRKVLGKLRFFEILRRMVLKLRAGGGPAPGELLSRVPVEEFEDNLRAMIRACQAEGSRPWVILQPDRPLPHADCWLEETHGLMERYRAAAERAGRDLEAVVIDLPGAFARAEAPAAGLFQDCVHPTPEGSRVVASSILEALEGSGLLPPRRDWVPPGEQAGGSGENPAGESPPGQGR